MSLKKIFTLSEDLEKGISDTIHTTRNNIGQLRYEVIPLSRIHLDPNNPRKLAITRLNLREPILESDPLFTTKTEEMEKLRSMANSIKKVGVRHAVEVYKEGSDYRLISGERRVLASLLAGKEDIPVRILENKPSTKDLKLLQWIENIEREDLSPWERVNNVKQLIDAHVQAGEEKGTTVWLGDVLGCSKQYASILISATEAPNDVMETLKLGQIGSLEKAAFLSKIKDLTQRKNLLDACIQGTSLDNMKKMYESKSWESAKEKNKREKKGRPISKIELGSTRKAVVVKKIITSILNLEGYSNSKHEFENVNWDDFASVREAFKKMLAIMEKKEGR